MLVLTIVLMLVAGTARAGRVWPVASADALRGAVRGADAGDAIELETGDYTLDLPLVLGRPLTVRSRDRQARAVLRSASPDGLLFVVTSSQVVLADLIVGAQTSGISDERSLDIYVGAGTQVEPTANDHYNADPQRRRGAPLPSREEIAVARSFQIENLVALRKRAEQAVDLRALHDVVLRNVDFSASRAAANVAFARGAYASVRIEQCVFGRTGAAHINALVAVAEARFAGLVVQRNTFAGDAHIVLAMPELALDGAIGLNYWPAALARAGAHSPPIYIGGARHVPTTYCLEASCTELAPVIDASARSRAFATLNAAAEAGVRHILITDDTELTVPALITESGTVIEGARNDQRAPLLTIRSGAALVSLGGALAGVRNVRLALIGPETAAVVYTDGVAQRLVGTLSFIEPLLVAAGATGDAESVESVVLFDGISVLGDDSASQVALVLNDAGVRVELEDSVVAQVGIGALVHRGALALLDTTVFGARRAAVLLETSTRTAGLRVSSSSFIGCETALETSGAGGIASLRELYVSCSQFLFNAQRDPLVARDCAARPTLCAAALRYNTIISEQADDARLATTAGTALRRLLRQGSNHLENGRTRTDYVYYGGLAHMRFEDDQGRFESVGAVLAAGAEPAAFVLASYAPVVDACFGIDALGGSAAAVSDVLEVRTDSLLHTDAALSVRFRSKDRSLITTPCSIYTVARLGTEATEWALVPTAPLRPEHSSWVLDATLGVQPGADHHAHRVVVVAKGTPPQARDDAVASGIAVSTVPPRVVAKRLCVVCGDAALPARLLDQFCDGSTENVRTTFDAAYDELGFGRGTGAPRAQTAALYLYGQCSTARCTVLLDHNEQLEGTSSSERATLRTMATECTEQSAFVDFLPRASAQSALHNLVIEQAPGIDCAVGVQPSTTSTGPIVAFNTLGGALCIDGRSGGLYVNNDIGATGVAVYVGGLFAARSLAPVVLEANVLTRGNVVIDGGASAAAQPVTLERLVFGATDRGVRVHGSALAVSITNCKNIGLVNALDADASVLVIASGNEWGHAPSIALRGQSLVTGGSFSGAAFELSELARLADAHLDADSIIRCKSAQSAVTLRDVVLVDIGRTLDCFQPFPACDSFELATAGIDLLQSTIRDASGRLLLQVTSAQQLADESAYWTRAGERARCAGGAVIRTADQCGCPGTVLAEPAGPHHGDRAIGDAPGHNQHVLSNSTETVDDDDDSDVDRRSVIAWVLAVAGAVVLLCAVGICVFAARSSSADDGEQTQVQSTGQMQMHDSDSDDEDDALKLTQTGTRTMTVRQRRPY